MKLVSALSKNLTVGPGGVELAGLPYGGPELLPLHKRYGERIKTLVKWDPDDLQFVYIQDPKTRGWILSECRWPEAAVGVSWNQHKLTRKFAREDLKEKDARESLRKSRLRLHEHWLSAVSHKSQKAALLAGQVSGVTSACVAKPKGEPAPIKQIVATEDATPWAAAEIPEFDTFSL